MRSRGSCHAVRSSSESAQVLCTHIREGLVVLCVEGTESPPPRSLKLRENYSCRAKCEELAHLLRC